MADDAGRATADRMRRRARWMRFGNIVMRRVLNLPFRTPMSSNLMLLMYRGRRTGRQYRQPVSYVVVAGDLLTPGGGRWKLNLSDGEPIRARLRGRVRRVTPELVRDPAEVARLLSDMLLRSRMLHRFVPFVHDGQIDPVGLERALANGFCIVRWHVEGSLK